MDQVSDTGFLPVHLVFTHVFQVGTLLNPLLSVKYKDKDVQKYSYLSN